MAESAPQSVTVNGSSDADARLNALIKQQSETASTLMAGSFELLGLDEIKEALGERWGQLAARASALAEAGIRQRLGETDLLNVLSDTEFSICFAELDGPGAIEKAKQIAREIKQEILTELPEFVSALTVKQFVAAIDIEKPAEEGQSLADRLVFDMRRMREEADQAVLNYRKLLLNDFKVVFAPVWDPHKAMVEVNRCVLDLSIGCKSLSQFQTIANPDQMTDTLADLDCLALTRGLEALHRYGRTGSVSSLLVPVSYQTLARMATRRDYFKLLASIPHVYHPFVRLEISNLPKRLDPHQLNNILLTLGAAKLRLAIQVNDSREYLDHIDPINLWGLSWNLTAGKLRGETQDYIGAPFWQFAKENGLRTLAHGANTMGLALAAVEVGFNYISGTAIHLSQDIPRPPSRMQPLTIPRGAS